MKYFQCLYLANLDHLSNTSIYTAEKLESFKIPLVNITESQINES